MRISVETSGGEAIVRGLHSAAAGIRDFSAPLHKAAFYLLFAIWNRITARPLNYSERYRLWLVSTGEWSGKLVGILTGALLGANAPAGGLGSTVTDREALVGFLNPAEGRKAAGFSRWYAGKYGEAPISLRPEDGEQIGRIFDNWLAGQLPAQGG